MNCLPWQSSYDPTKQDSLFPSKWMRSPLATPRKQQPEVPLGIGKSHFFCGAGVCVPEQMREARRAGAQQTRWAHIRTRLNPGGWDIRSKHTVVRILRFALAFYCRGVLELLVKRISRFLWYFKPPVGTVSRRPKWRFDLVCSSLAV